MTSLFTPGRSLVTGGSLTEPSAAEALPPAHSCGYCRNPFTGGREDCPKNLSNPRRIGAPRPPRLPVSGHTSSPTASTAGCPTERCAREECVRPGHCHPALTRVPALLPFLAAPTDRTTGDFDD